MKRFRFALHPVAVLRAHRELQAQERFATAVQICVQAEQKLASMRQRVAELEGALLAGRQERYDPVSAASSIAGYCRECAAELSAEKALATARQQVHERRFEYLDEHRRLEVVRRLEQKARQAHQADGRREEQAAFDDVSGGRFIRYFNSAVRLRSRVA